MFVCSLRHHTAPAENAARAELARLVIARRRAPLHRFAMHRLQRAPNARHEPHQHRPPVELSADPLVPARKRPRAPRAPDLPPLAHAHQTTDPSGVALQQALPRAPPPSSEQDPLSRKTDDRRDTGRLRRCGCGGDGVGLLRGEPDVHHVGAVRRELLPQRRHPIQRPEFLARIQGRETATLSRKKVSAKTKEGGESLAYELWDTLLGGGNQGTAPDFEFAATVLFSGEKRAFGRTIVVHSSLPQEAAPR